MIVSASRRTDIPAFYSDWFFNRIHEGFLDVRNPFNAHQISRILLSPELVDCIVFWTKNPVPMLKHLGELSGYAYYVQFTLTGYGRDVEAGLPSKKQVLIPAFQELSRAVGRERVIWRYDPILINAAYTREYHLRAFREIAASLKGYTDRVVISFLDMYRKIEKNMERLGVCGQGTGDMISMAAELAEIARDCGMTVESCAEAVDLSAAGVEHGSCIDRRLIERLTGCRIAAKKDGGQRPECGCAESIDVGAYNTCLNGCAYCYANFDPEGIRRHRERFNSGSTILGAPLGPGDMVRERPVRSLRSGQMSLFD